MSAKKHNLAYGLIEKNFKFFFSILILSVFLSVAGVAPAGAQTSRAAKPGRLLEAERILSNLGYWITKIDGVSDASTRHAIIAFQKVERRKKTGVLTDAELRAMRAAARPQPREANGAHIEIDLTRQVLFLIDAQGAVTHILPVSSGNEQKYFDQGSWQIAHTPRGSFQVTRQIDGVRHAPLGSLYYPSYFVGGVAIHGSPSVPVYPASHGCVRIPNFAAKDFLKMIAVGTPVLVYD